MLPLRSSLARILAPWWLVASAFAQDGATLPVLRGELRPTDGVDVLFLHGSEDERGFAEGYLVGDRIRELVAEFCLSKRVVPSAAVWERGIRPRIASRMLVEARQRERAEATLAGMRARGLDLRIAALGRELDALDLLAASALPDFTGLACSSFAVHGPRVVGRGPIVGRNLDYFATAAVVRHILVVVNAPAEGRLGWVGIGWPGDMGCLTGVSESGTFLSIHDVATRGGDPQAKFTPRPRALQRLVETLVPGEEPAQTAHAMLRDHRFVLGGNFLLAWRGATLGAVVFEVDGRPEDGGVTLRLPLPGDDFITCTNHHRVRQDPAACRRYAGILDAERATQEREAPLGVADVWRVIETASVSGTLYRCVADLGTGTLELDRRVRKDADDWHPRAHLETRELLATARRLAAGGK